MDPDRLPRRRPSPSRRDHLRHRHAAGGSGACASSCAAPGSPTPPKPSCGPTGATTPSSPTSTCPPSPSTSSTATTPPSSSPSATSKKAPGSSTARSGRFFANAAWLACAVLAHNLTRWTARLGGVHPDDQLTVTRTIRTRLLALPGRLVNRSRTLDPAAPRPLAMGHHLQHRPRPDPVTAAADLNNHSGPARPQTTTTRRHPDRRTQRATDALHQQPIVPLATTTPQTTTRHRHPSVDRWIEAKRCRSERPRRRAST